MRLTDRMCDKDSHYTSILAKAHELQMHLHRSLTHTHICANSRCKRSCNTAVYNWRETSETLSYCQASTSGKTMAMEICSSFCLIICWINRARRFAACCVINFVRSPRSKVTEVSRQMKGIDADWNLIVTRCLTCD